MQRGHGTSRHPGQCEIVTTSRRDTSRGRGRLPTLQKPQYKTSDGQSVDGFWGRGQNADGYVHNLVRAIFSHEKEMPGAKKKCHLGHHDQGHHDQGQPWRCERCSRLGYIRLQWIRWISGLLISPFMDLGVCRVVAVSGCWTRDLYRGCNVLFGSTEAGENKRRKPLIS